MTSGVFKGYAVSLCVFLTIYFVQRPLMAYVLANPIFTSVWNPVPFADSSSEDNTVLIICIILAVLVLILIVVVIIVCCYKQKQKKADPILPEHQAEPVQTVQTTGVSLSTE